MSSILQYLSFETIESMLYQMKSLNLKQFQTEFLMLTIFHAQEFQSKIDRLSRQSHSVDDGLKAQMKGQIDEFLASLFTLA